MPTLIENKDTYKVSVSNLYTFSKISVGNVIVYSAGNTVTYHIDTNVVYQEEVDADETVLSPKTFTPTKSEWNFVGWRIDGVASGDVLDDLNMGDEPIELYAVFQQPVTLSYNANGGSGTMTEVTKQRHYNNTISDPEFTLSSNSFTAPTGYNFSKWARGSAESGTQYTEGVIVALSENTTFYAVWTYVGSPYYIVENMVCKTALNWTITNYDNTYIALGSTTNCTVGLTLPTIFAYLNDNSEGGSISAISAAINTRGNKTLECTFNHSGSAIIKVNGKTFYSSFTVDISNVSSITISVYVDTYAYGSAYFQPVTLRLY